MEDETDRHVARWLQELPDLDPLVEAIAARIAILNGRLNRRRQRQMNPILEPWQYKTLLALRGRGTPYRATPKELAAVLGLSPAAISKRLAALESQGLVTRSHGDADRRRVHVTLTSKGKAAWQRATRAGEDAEAEFFSALSVREKTQLGDLLRKVVCGDDKSLSERR